MRFVQINAVHGLALAAAMIATAAQADVKAGVDAWQAGDFGRAVAEWRPLADKGDADAMFNLGQAYKLGQGVPKNLPVAQDWYAKAAAKGHEQAQATLGLILFQNGDRTGAMPWLKKAAEAGEPRAQYIYGTALYNGDVVSRDLAQAYAMMTRAAAAGLPQATNSLAVMDQRMSLPDRTRGTELAAKIPALMTTSVLASDRPTATGSAAPSRGSPRLASASAPAAPPSAPAKTEPAKLAAPSAAKPSPKAAEKVAAKPETPKPAAKAPEKLAAKPEAPKPAPAKAAAPAAKVGGPWRVQLGAFGSADAARAAWKGFAGAGALGGRGPSYVAAGKVTRLQVAGFASQAAAVQACAAIKRSGKSCIPAK